MPAAEVILARIDTKQKTIAIGISLNEHKRDGSLCIHFVRLIGLILQDLKGIKLLFFNKKNFGAINLVKNHNTIMTRTIQQALRRLKVAYITNN